jgi:hypothetical protein
MTEQEHLILNLESFWCQRMTELHEQNKIDDLNALFSEFVLNDEDPFLNMKGLSQWTFLELI